MNKKLNLPQTLITGVLFVTLAGFTSCKKEEIPEPGTGGGNSTTETVALPASTVTTYDGELSYTPTIGDPILVDDGSATISQSGSSYTIDFSDGVPTLEDLKFKNEDGAYATIAEDGSLSGISIDGADLAVGVFSGGNTWSFSGSH